MSAFDAMPRYPLARWLDLYFVPHSGTPLDSMECKQSKVAAMLARPGLKNNNIVNMSFYIDFVFSIEIL